MKAISIYQRRGFLYPCPYARTVHGVSVLIGPCVKLSVASATATELGAAAFESLNQAGEVVPHPEDWDELPPSAILQAAGVKSWRTFSKGARTIDLDLMETEFVLTPMRQEGRLDFIPLNDQKLHLPRDCTAEALGEAITRALARCR